MMSTLAGNVLSEGAHTLSYVLPGLAVTGAGLKAATKVPQEYVGLRTHLGKARRPKDSGLPWSNARAGDLYGLVYAGLHMTMPFTHSIEKISLQDRTSPLEPITVDSANGRQYQIGSSVIWGVVRDRDERGELKDYGIEYSELVFRAIYNAQGEEALNSAVSGICMSGLRQVMLAVEEPRAVNPRDVQDELKESCSEELLDFGVELRRLNLFDTAYSNADVLGTRLTSLGGSLGMAAVVADEVPDLFQYRARTANQ